MRKLLASVLLLALLLTMVPPAFAAEPATPTGIPFSELERRIDELVATYLHEYAPGAAIAVVHEGEIIFSRGYGSAEFGRQISIDPAATVFEYGSIAKLFVYVATMQLVEQGLLDLDADVHTYLPADFARELNFQRTFTVRDLLNHSAGFGEFFFNTFYDAELRETPIPLRGGLLMSQPRQIFEPGTASSYSNFGSALLGYIVATVSGQEFTDFERESILVPVGMVNTRGQGDWFGDTAYMSTQARGHAPDGSGGFYQMLWVYIPIYPAGSLRGTAEDLARFAIALTPPTGEAGPLFQSRETLDLMLSPSYTNPDVMRGMLHGFMSYDGVYPAIGHGGGTVGFNTEFAIVPSERFGVVVLTNAVGGAMFNERLLDLLIGNSVDTIGPPVNGLPDARSVAGDFVMLRRHEGNLLQPLNFLFGTNMRVDAIDAHTIEVNAMGMTVQYQQVEPYVFRILSPSPMIGRVGYDIRFQMENGSPVGISIRGPFDATVQTFGQSVTALLISAVVAAISILFFLIAPIVVFIGFLRKREKGTSLFHHLSNGFLLSGTALALNNLILFLRMGASIPFVPTSMVTPHTWMNYILLALTGAFFLASLLVWKRDVITTKRRVLYVLTVIFTALFAVFLWHWNLFVFM
ncbi:MAG: beta-lactamase family protein [Oscillospiraceae bacterium]|nr:beta-lactamase family protein [Oscillospiraceae bacterium]